ncbi:DUF4367 domain-containing protein [Butyrivibrio sp. VCD2006]|uniref:DUF4367 domain-containing protein n=1 Tax=Butyrivibrio sp. VCD2006 TaxID=1280664 RepID=UPI00040A5FFA|nr:DUF4367 domain-containing protein [Butyrivibrio sp. VCD2006]
MNTTFEEMLSYTVREEMISILAPDIEKWTGSVHEKVLRRAEIKKLADIILNLPQKGQEILLGRYAFDLTPENVEIIYGISEADIRREFFERQLAHEMGLEAGERIAENSLYEACRKAMRSLTEDILEHKKQKNIILMFAKTAAAILVVGLLAFGTAMGVNAEFRNSVVSWLMESTKAYTLFHIEESEDAQSSNLGDYEPTYIPQGYHSYSKDVLTGFATYTYEDENGDLLDISICMPEANAYLNTEGMKKEVITINGQQAFLYHDGVHGSLATSIDGYALYVTGKANRDDFIKIAENVVKK